MPKNYLFRTFFITVGYLAILPGLFWGNITNNGNDAVEIKVVKEGGQYQRFNIYPDQTVELPQDTVQVQVVPRSRTRGDENIEVTIVEPDGKTGTIDKMGGIYVLKQENTLETETVLQAGSVQNLGSVDVDIVVHLENGTIQTQQVFMEQTVSIPKEATEVTVDMKRAMRGDEKILVEVIMPDGKSTTIKTRGGKATLEQKNKFNFKTLTSGMSK
ncbi:MAG: hypothetical protein NC930_06620 [Candidatus Omnitrophica bacterium]|nr:hypothetical protein [Candidatus Omnitrophota bacterium]